MIKTQLLIVVVLIWNYEVTHASLCGSVNGNSCCSGYQWDEIQQNCIPCGPGYTGMNCDIKCIYPSYGKDCQSTCTCEEIDCHVVYGCIKKKNICNVQTGTITCCNGYRWNEEKTKCIPCDKGFTGYNCEVTCRFPSYGLDCQAICNCIEANCNPKDGCSGNSTRFEITTSHSPAKTTNPKVQKVEVVQIAPTDSKQQMIMTGIGVLAAVALFIVLAIFYTYRMENNSKKESDSNIYYSIK